MSSSFFLIIIDPRLPQLIKHRMGTRCRPTGPQVPYPQEKSRSQPGVVNSANLPILYYLVN